MFERRLWVLFGVFALVSVTLIGRLFQLQIVHGADYRAEADRVMLRAPRLLPFVRGRILDRNGVALARDEPALDVTVHYGVLSDAENYLSALARDVGREAAWRGHSREAVTIEVRRRIDEMWSQLSSTAGVPMSELQRRREAIRARVEALRHHIWKARKGGPLESTLDGVRLAEQNQFHPIIRDVSPEARTRIELSQTQRPFVRLESSVRRSYEAPPAMMHLVGRMGQVSTEDIEHDPRADDNLARYRPGDLHGVRGLEALAESELRGRRGAETLDLDDQAVDRILPRDGRDVRITIDLEIQQRAYAVLEKAVAESVPEDVRCGAACAIIDLPSREVVALVSYPSYSATDFDERYTTLRDDTRLRPLWPRAAAFEYPPGSVIKPACLIAGLSSGVWSASRVVDCEGRLFRDVDAWRCGIWFLGGVHGPQGAVEAIQHSCNIYFYKIGAALGPRRLTLAYQRLLYGPADGNGAPAWTGTGLIEERNGLIPTPQRIGRAFTRADARNYAIGQGELQITPLQAATLMSTIACGDFLSPALVAPRAPRMPQPLPDVTAETWRIVREGMYRCVNERGGTAEKEGRSDLITICGKTGSAQSVRRVTKRKYTFPTEHGDRSVIAPTVEAARDWLDLPHDAKPGTSQAVEFWPRKTEDGADPPTHAWFAGYAPRDHPKYAIAVVVEYGGGGGGVAAPAAREILESLLVPDRSPAAMRRHGNGNRKVGSEDPTCGKTFAEPSACHPALIANSQVDANRGPRAGTEFPNHGAESRS
jgi:penicillin-binding protein 2